MSVHLVGGGATTVRMPRCTRRSSPRPSCGARAAGRARPRIAVISLHPEAQEKAAALADLLVAAGSGDEIEVQLTAGRPGEPIGLAAIADVDGIAVGGGLVEEVRAGLEPVFGELRRLVAGGVPYLGVSAGAMIAAEGSLGSGSRIGGVVVAPEDPDEPGSSSRSRPASAWSTWPSRCTSPSAACSPAWSLPSNPGSSAAGSASTSARR